MIPVLYEDNHLLVVEKPVNMPVQADATGDLDLLTMLKSYIKEKYAKPGEVYLALVHRLDRPVGGVMVFARTSKAASRLSAQFASHAAKKRYVAAVSGTPRAEGTLTDFLVKDENTHSSFVVPEGTPGGKQARLSYSLIGRAAGASLLDVRLETGRPHQIRVQLSNAGCPILFDQRYNKSAVPGGQIALWAYALTIEHPTLSEEMTFFSAPKGPGFTPFAAQTALLPAFSACRGIAVTTDRIAVDKNAGVEVESDLLSELLSIYPEIYPVHRLDANTEGVVLFARTPSEKESLEQKFYAHTLEKTYLAIVLGTPGKTGKLVHYGVKDAAHACMRIVPEGTENSVRMSLSYRVLSSDGARSLVEISLETGRTHQIRAQFSAIGHPVLGDDRYGDRAANKRFAVRRQQLLAKKITLDGITYESLRELTL